jgi:NTP pyrophosphatase (non-canonical NTP hydrolase)
MAKEGLREQENINEELAHELSDCLWSILVLANSYEIDLEEAFLQTMDQLENKIDSQLHS